MSGGRWAERVPPVVGRATIFPPRLEGRRPEPDPWQVRLAWFMAGLATGTLVGMLHPYWDWLLP